MDEVTKLKIQAELAQISDRASKYTPLFRALFEDPDACLAAMCVIGEKVKKNSDTPEGRRAHLWFFGKFLSMSAGENSDAFTNR